MFTNSTLFLKTISIIWLLCILPFQGYAQSQENPYVHWVSEIPKPESQKKSIGLFKGFGNFFFGKPPVLLNKPISVIAINPDTLWMLDQGNGKLIQVLNSSPTTPPFFTKSAYHFSSLLGLSFFSSNEFLFTDSRLNKVFHLNMLEKKLQSLNDSLKFEQPTGIAYSKKSNEIWVVETAAHQIKILYKNGELKKTIGKRGTAEGEFNFPTFISIDNVGFAYVVDAMNFRVQIFNSEGEFVSAFGKTGDVSGSFSSPKGIATDSFGNIYVADALFHVVQIFDKSGNFLYRFGSQGHESGQFWMPTGIYIDDKNYIYVADSYNSRIQIFQLMNGR